MRPVTIYFTLPVSSPSPPIQYIQRTRSWYQGLGYGEPYQWAQFDQVPFCQPEKILADSTIGLVTTAARYQPTKGDQGPGAAYNGAAKFYAVYVEPTDGDTDVRISHIAYDRKHTSAEDKNTWFPLEALARLRDAGTVGNIARHFFGLPTNRSQRITVEQDCPALLQRLKEDAVDLALLVANCPVCHQSVSLAARYLEQHGMPTVILGCARDIVEHVGVPRFLFSDFPLGNAAGKPFDADSQNRTLTMALHLFDSASQARTTRQSPLRWRSDDLWKQDYSNIELLDEREIRQRKAEFDRQKQRAKQQRQGEC